MDRIKANCNFGEVYHCANMVIGVPASELIWACLPLPHSSSNFYPQIFTALSLEITQHCCAFAFFSSHVYVRKASVVGTHVRERGKETHIQKKKELFLILLKCVKRENFVLLHSSVSIKRHLLFFVKLRQSILIEGKNCSFDNALNMNMGCRKMCS